MKEIRVAEIRADAPAGAESLVLVGTPIVYDTPTTIHDPAGEYIEIIQRGALDGADLSDVRLFLQPRPKQSAPCPPHPAQCSLN